MTPLERCRTEREAAEALLRNGHPEIDGLTLAVTDWSAEERAIERERYQSFLASKAVIARSSGFGAKREDLNSHLFEFQKDVVLWALQGGSRAIFASFGLGKTLMQIQILVSILAVEPGAGLIICPLGVRGEFLRDALRFFSLELFYVRTNEEYLAAVDAGQRLFITNYERVRDGDLDPNKFRVVSLDEASVLRSYGSKTYQTFLTLFADVPYKFVCTATPSPNRLKELIHYAGFLGIMDTGQALTRFFKRDSTTAGNLTIHPHKIREWWLWVSTWATFVTRPSDLGYPDTGYDLPKMNLIRHRLPVDHASAGYDSWGQGKLLRNGATSLRDAAKERRDSIDARVQRAVEIVDAAWTEDFDAGTPKRKFIVWHDLEDERLALEKAFSNMVTIWGAQASTPAGLERRERTIADFSDGLIDLFGSKPSLTGSGCNFQRYCYSAIFLGIGYKANDFMQAVHRILRYLQTHEVDTHLIYMESEDPIHDTLMEKCEQHRETAETMTKIMKEYGLVTAGATAEMRRSVGVERRESKGDLYTCVHNDNVPEMERFAKDSVDLIVTSWPFSDHYEYTESYNDFGHNDGDAGFFEQMEFLTPHIKRALRPGRIYAVHVKDRLLYGSVTGLGMYSVNPFSDKCVAHLRQHGLIYCGRITIVTDVVRENSQTYRLGWSENCKDGTKMGVGSPEYVLLFRKLPTDQGKAYADAPVQKLKPRCRYLVEMHLDPNTGEFVPDETEVPFEKGLPIIPGTGYSRSRWQFDASPFWRSRGNRFLTPSEICEMPQEMLRKLWHEWSSANLHDHEQHVRIAESLEARGLLPASFMLLDPKSHSPWVWDDVVRMRTLNGDQVRKRLEVHVCPLQFDIVERLIERYSMPGELVLDPFGGLMTVPYCALKMGRRGYGIELNSEYYADGVGYCRAMEEKVNMPTLFDMTEGE